MNLKKELKKLDIYDLKFICNEVGIKYKKKSSKQIIIRELLKPINKKHKYATDSKDFDFDDYYNSKFELTEKGLEIYKQREEDYRKVQKEIEDFRNQKEIIEIENELDFFDQFEGGRLELFQNQKDNDFLHIYGYLFKDLIDKKYIVRV